MISKVFLMICCAFVCVSHSLPFEPKATGGYGDHSTTAAGPVADGHGYVRCPDGSKPFAGSDGQTALCEIGSSATICPVNYECVNFGGVANICCAKIDAATDPSTTGTEMVTTPGCPNVPQPTQPPSDTGCTYAPKIGASGCLESYDLVCPSQSPIPSGDTSTDAITTMPTELSTENVANTTTPTPDQFQSSTTGVPIELSTSPSETPIVGSSTDMSQSSSDTPISSESTTLATSSSIELVSEQTINSNPSDTTNYGNMNPELQSSAASSASPTLGNETEATATTTVSVSIDTNIANSTVPVEAATTTIYDVTGHCVDTQTTENGSSLAPDQTSETISSNSSTVSSLSETTIGEITTPPMNFTDQPISVPQNNINETTMVVTETSTSFSIIVPDQPITESSQVATDMTTIGSGLNAAENQTTSPSGIDVVPSENQTSMVESSTTPSAVAENVTDQFSTISSAETPSAESTSNTATMISCEPGMPCSSSEATATTLPDTGNTTSAVDQTPTTTMNPENGTSSDNTTTAVDQAPTTTMVAENGTTSENSSLVQSSTPVMNCLPGSEQLCATEGSTTSASENSTTTVGPDNAVNTATDSSTVETSSLLSTSNAVIGEETASTPSESEGSSTLESSTMEMSTSGNGTESQSSSVSVDDFSTTMPTEGIPTTTMLVGSENGTSVQIQETLPPAEPVPNSTINGSTQTESDGSSTSAPSTMEISTSTNGTEPLSTTQSGSSVDEMTTSMPTEGMTSTENGTSVPVQETTPSSEPTPTESSGTDPMVPGAFDWPSMFSLQSALSSIPDAVSFRKSVGPAVPTSGRFVPCSRNSDCFNLREPSEWCERESFFVWTDKSCFCAADTEMQSCVIERFDMKSKQVQWTFCSPDTQFRCNY